MVRRRLKEVEEKTVFEIAASITGEMIMEEFGIKTIQKEVGDLKTIIRKPFWMGN
jgi:hypothetical protein